MTFATQNRVPGRTYYIKRSIDLDRLPNWQIGNVDTPKQPWRHCGAEKTLVFCEPEGVANEAVLSQESNPKSHLGNQTSTLPSNQRFTIVIGKWTSRSIAPLINSAKNDGMSDANRDREIQRIAQAVLSAAKSHFGGRDPG